MVVTGGNPNESNCVIKFYNGEGKVLSEEGSSNIVSWRLIKLINPA